MGKARHMGIRMSQRGINSVLVDLTLQFGEDIGDKCVLSRQGLKQLISSLRALERAAMHALDKGGIVVVQVDGSLITTYSNIGNSH